jgi:uncharacterized protein
MPNPEILWRRLDRPGHEAARLVARGGGWELRGTAVFLHDGQPCRLDYQVDCAASWRTTAGWVEGWVGEREIAVEITVEAGRWKLNGAEAPEVAGCTDLDLNFSPSTNLLPIRRLGLAPGAQAEVRAAWLRFPGFHLEPLEQVYRRLDPATWRYESAGGTFVRDLPVDENGFVTLYPDFWQAEG